MITGGPESHKPDETKKSYLQPIMGVALFNSLWQNQNAGGNGEFTEPQPPLTFIRT